MNLAIIGTGPAGLAAAVSAASDGLETLCLEGNPEAGGQALNASRIENYLGFVNGLSGKKLTTSARAQAERFGAKFVLNAPVVDCRETESGIKIVCAQGDSFIVDAALIASGVAYKLLNVPGIEPLLGRGVFYGSSPENASEYSGKHVITVGGANSAGQAAINLAKNGAQVSMLTRSPLVKSMSGYLLGRIEASKRIFVREGSRVAAVHGTRSIEAITIADGNGVSVENCAALFVFIGAEPRTDWINVPKDSKGFIKSNEYYATGIDGIFVAGDVREGSVKRVAAAAGEGSTVIASIHNWLKKKGK
jgi:thioredoxin reductase (NADPH)